MITSKVVLILAFYVQVYEFRESIFNFENCSSYMNTNNQYRILRTAVPSTPLSDFNGKYCGHSEKTCCTQEVEESLKEMAKADYEKSVKKILTNLSRMFKSKSSKFNEYFKDLLDKSKKDFHEMFKKTYGMVYEQNSYVFSDFFVELETYFSNGKSNLADVMDTFFNILYQKMFTVMNSQFRFDDKYLGCVSEHMNELKPFGDVPQKLSLPLKRSFVAARIYSQSLYIVGEVITNLISLMPSENCYNAVTKMLHCSACKNYPSAKVCHGFCVNVMKGCLAFHGELDTEWNSFVDVLHKVQQRLLGPFNLELVVEPINVKISEAIMNFQENSNHVSTKVFNGCGRPPLLDSRRRRRRDANSHENVEQRNNVRNNNGDNRDNNERRRNGKGGGSSSASQNRNAKGRRKGGKVDSDANLYKSSPIDGFHKFIQEIGDQVLPTKYFWKRLPFIICTEDMNVEKNRNSYCWNGQTMGKYEVPEVEDGLKNQQFNREVSIDPKHQSTTIREQVFTLKSVIMQLKNAYNGQDVEWIDSEESFESGSGSGMYPPDPDDFSSINPTEGSGFEPSSKTDTSVTFDSSDNTGVLVKSTPTDGYDIGGPNSTERVPFTRVSNAENTPSETTSYTDSGSSVSVTDSTTISTNYNVSSTISHNVTTSDGTTIRYDKVSLNQAIATYLLPTVVVWFGGSFNEWFHTFMCNFQF